MNICSAKSRVVSVVATVIASILCGTVLYAQQVERTGDDGTENVGRDTVSASVIQDEPEDLALRVLVAGDNEGPAFSRRSPDATQPMTQDELGKVNPQGLEQDVTIPLRGYPDPSAAPVPNKPFYAEASLGLFMTGTLHAGYSGSIWPYDFSARIDAKTTQGFVEHADGNLLNGEFSGGYIIGDDYGIFSGGYMGAEGQYGKEEYRLYALEDAPQRELSTWRVGMKGANTYDDISFDAKGRYRDVTLTEQQDSAGNTAYERAFEGALEVSTMWSGLKWSGTADMSLSSYSGESISYGRLSGYAEFSKAFITLHGGGNLAVGANSDGTSSARVAPRAEVRIFPLNGFILSGGLNGGVMRSSLEEIVTLNPYVSTNTAVMHEDVTLGYDAAVRIEPTSLFGIRLSGARNFYDRYLSFRATDQGRFLPDYKEATIDKVIADAYLNIGNNEMKAAVTFMEGTFGSDGRPLPYVPKWDVELGYTRSLLVLPLSVTGTLRYISERDASPGMILGEAFLFSLEGKFSLSSILDLTLRIDNLFDQRYEIWEGYRERGVFMAVGAKTRL